MARRLPPPIMGLSTGIPMARRLRPQSGSHPKAGSLEPPVPAKGSDSSPNAYRETSIGRGSTSIVPISSSKVAAGSSAFLTPDHPSRYQRAEPLPTRSRRNVQITATGFWATGSLAYGILPCRLNSFTLAAIFCQGPGSAYLRISWVR